MANNNLKNKYFVRKTTTAAWEDVTTKFEGVKILSIAGMLAIGETTNVYNEQWQNSSVEDYLIANQDEYGNDVVVRKNVDIKVTFIVSKRYSALSSFNVLARHNAFVDYVCNHGDFFIKSAYTNLQAHVACVGGYEPTKIKLQRGNESYILGTITLHLLEPVSVP